MENRLELKGISKSFKNNSVLENVHLDFHGGRICGIVGENGCGKTVLMKCICGLMPPDTGEILLNGKRPLKGSFGIIIETPGFLNEFSGYQNLKMLASLRRSVRTDEMMRILRTVSLEEAARKKVGSYSLGMRQRLGLAQALMDDPPVYLLDEPFNALDKTSRQQIYQILAQEKVRGKIIVLSSHHPDEIEALCDEVYDFRQHQFHQQQEG